MAIAIDTTATGVATGTTQTLSYTCTGSDLILWVAAINQSDTAAISGITYNGVAMTEVAHRTDAAIGYYVSLWYLINPATGTHDIISSTGVSKTVRLMAASYTGAKQSGQPDSSNSATQSTTSSVTYSTTVVATGCWLVSVQAGDANSSTWTAGAGSFMRQNPGTASQMMLDSNAAVATGSVGLVTDFSGTHDTNCVIASFAPVPTTAIKTVDGLATASVKTVDGLAIASIKTINGLN